MQTLEAVEGNRVQAAKIPGIDRRTLYNKLRQYKIEQVFADESAGRLAELST